MDISRAKELSEAYKKARIWQNTANLLDDDDKPLHSREVRRAALEATEDAEDALDAELNRLAFNSNLTAEEARQVMAFSRTAKNWLAE